MKILDNRQQSGQIEATVEHDDQFSTFGGEYWDDNYQFVDYGLDLGDVSFSSISAKQMKHLGLAIINHLITCGHDFEIAKDHNGEYLRQKS